jgi:hypothetical protein
MASEVLLIDGVVVRTISGAGGGGEGGGGSDGAESGGFDPTSGPGDSGGGFDTGLSTGGGAGPETGYGGSGDTTGVGDGGGGGADFDPTAGPGDIAGPGGSPQSGPGGPTSGGGAGPEAVSGPGTPTGSGGDPSAPPVDPFAGFPDITPAPTPAPAAPAPAPAAPATAPAPASREGTRPGAGTLLGGVLETVTGVATGNPVAIGKGLIDIGRGGYGLLSGGATLGNERTDSSNGIDPFGGFGGNPQTGAREGYGEGDLIDTFSGDRTHGGELDGVDSFAPALGGPAQPEPAEPTPAGEGGEGEGGGGDDSGLPPPPAPIAPPPIPAPQPPPSMPNPNNLDNPGIRETVDLIDQARRFGRQSTLITGGLTEQGEAPSLGGAGSRSRPGASEPQAATREGTRPAGARSGQTLSERFNEIERENAATPPPPGAPEPPEVRDTLPNIVDNIGNLPSGWTVTHQYQTIPYQVVKDPQGRTWVRSLLTGELVEDIVVGAAQEPRLR